MEQIAKSFDPVTIAKMKNSALIAASGFLVIAVPFLSAEINAFLTKRDPIDWVSVVVMLVTAASTWCVNSIKEWRDGVEQ